MRLVRNFLVFCFLAFSVSFSPPLSAASVPYPECENAPHRNLCLVLERIREFSYTSFTAETLEAKVLSVSGMEKIPVPIARECIKEPYPSLCAFVSAYGRQRSEYFLKEILPRFIDHFYYWPPSAKTEFGQSETIIPWETGKGRVDIYSGAIESEASIFSEYGVFRSIKFRSSYNDGICSTKWNEFDRRVPPRFFRAIEECRAKGKLLGIIIDLMDNPGGNLGSTLEIASAFLPEGSLIMYEQNKDKEPLSEVKGWFPAHPDLAKVPLVILVNKDSASASEILASSLKHYRRAIILGTDPRTYGKYTGQQIFTFDNGTWAVAFTVTEWFHPDKISNKGGIAPDRVVPKTKIYDEARAILKNFRVHLIL